MQYTILLSADAELDLIEGSDWYEQQRPHLGAEFELCVEVRLLEISRNPHECQQRYREVHIAFVDRFPYGIHYLVGSSEVYVIGIFHTSRNPTNWDKRSS